MALINCNVFSTVLDRDVGMFVALPQNIKKNEKLKVCYLLHGYKGNFTFWVKQLPMEELANKYHIAIIMPDGNKSFYLNAEVGEKYYTHTNEHVPEMVQDYFPVSVKKEDRAIAGIGMGGYGALRIAFLSNSYKIAGSFDGTLDISKAIKRMQNTPNSISRQIEALFGNCNRIKNSDNDLFYLAKKNMNNLQMYISCNSEGELRDMNQEFVKWRGTGVEFEIFEEKKYYYYLEKTLEKFLERFLKTEETI